MKRPFVCLPESPLWVNLNNVESIDLSTGHACIRLVSGKRINLTDEQADDLEDCLTERG